MRPPLTFVCVALFSLVGCRQALLGTRAARVTVHAAHFHPGCLHLLISDGNNHSMDKDVAPAPDSDSTVIAVYRPAADWSDSMTISVTPYERACDAAPSPLGAPQVVTKPLEFRIPTAFDFSFDFPDSDGDGFVAKDRGGTDCRDDDRAIHPGAPELCDTRDNNCDGQIDEGFDAGAACQGACTNGQLFCAPDGTQACSAPAAPPVWYADDDGDGDGDPGAASPPSCAPPDAGYVADASDCDDGDPYNAPGRAELCDGRDNNCDGQVDEGGVCGDGGFWTAKLIGNSASEDFHTLTVWGDGGVWVAGKGDSLRYKLPDAGTFVKAFPCRAGTDWYASWADSNGRVYLGGTTRGTNRDPTPSATCPDYGTENDTLTGMTGFGQGSSGGLFWSTDGGLVSGVIGGSFRTAAVPLDIHDLHGLSYSLMFAVGDDGDAGRIYRGFAPDGGWTAEAVNVPNTTLNAVQVVSPKLAFAVGANGTVLEWNGATWTRRPYDNDAGVLRSVLAFGRNNVYVVDSNSVRRTTAGGGWETVFTLADGGTGLPLWDLAGSSPDDIWGAGNDGYVVHWPN